MKFKLIIAVALSSLFLFASCSATRKCDGSKGVKTNMGTM